MPNTGLTAAIVATHGTMFDRLVASAGFHVVAVARTAVLGEGLIAITRPDVVVVENELPGEQGIEALHYLRRASPESDFVLVVADELVEIDSGRTDAYAVLARSRLVELPDLLGVLGDRLSDDQGRFRVRTERRSGQDRRCRQDWSKVGWDKRRGTERRVVAKAGRASMGRRSERDLGDADVVALRS